MVDSSLTFVTKHDVLEGVFVGDIELLDGDDEGFLVGDLLGDSLGLKLVWCCIEGLPDGRALGSALGMDEGVSDGEVLNLLLSEGCVDGLGEG